MGVMKEFEATSTLFGANAPFIEELYESYLADPEAVSPEWRAYFDELRGDAQDVAHAPVVESFRELARSRKAAYAMVDSASMRAVSGLSICRRASGVNSRVSCFGPTKSRQRAWERRSGYCRPSRNRRALLTRPFLTGLGGIQAAALGRSPETSGRGSQPRRRAMPWATKVS